MVTSVDPVETRVIATPQPSVVQNVSLITTTPTTPRAISFVPPTSTIQFISPPTRSPQQLAPRDRPQLPFTFVSSPPTLSHMDMARPPHEDPDYRRQYGISPSFLSSSWPKSASYLVTKFACLSSDNKIIYNCRE